MPNKYKPLTNEEKEQARKTFEEFIQKTNAFLQKNNQWEQFNYDEELKKFEARLNDQELVARYRLSQELIEKRKAHNAAYDEAKDALKGPNGEEITIRNNLLSRSFVYLFKTDGSLESKEYNKDLLNKYAENPEAFTHSLFKKIMNYDPKELIECGNDKVKLIEFYKANEGFCLAAQDFGSASIIENKDFGVIKEMQEAAKSMKGLIEKINYPGNLSEETNYLESFAIPEMNPEKAKYFCDNSKAIYGAGKTPKGVNKVLLGIFNKKSDLESPVDYYQKLKDKGLVFDKNFFTKYKFIYTDPQTNERKETEAENFLNNKPNVTVEERTPEEIKKLNEFSKTFQDRYYNVFKEKFNTHRGREYNLTEIKNEVKGGFFARIFRRPSNEFKIFMTKLEEYNNPQSANYLNKDALAKAGEAYIRHTGIDIDHLEDARMNSTRTTRVNLVVQTLNTIKELEKDDAKIRNEINASISALSPKDLGIHKEPAVEEDALEEIVPDMNEKDINDINMNIENNELNNN